MSSHSVSHRAHALVVNVSMRDRIYKPRHFKLFWASCFYLSCPFSTLIAFPITGHHPSPGKASPFFVRPNPSFA
jgi:hypothetical protein